MENPNEAKVRKPFDDQIESIYGTHLAPPPNWYVRQRRRGDDKLEEDLLWEGLVEKEEQNEEIFK